MMSAQQSLEENHRHEAWSAWVDQGSAPSRRNNGINYSLGFNPYATIQLRTGRHWNADSPYRQTLKKLVNSPFKRIKRVEAMIMAHKIESKDLSSVAESYLADNQLRPQFKIKTWKASHQKQSAKAEETETKKDRLHVRNFTLDSFHKMGSGQVNEQTDNGSSLSCNIFQSNFKNRCKLNRCSPRRLQEVSLLDRLNKISQKQPLQKSKFRAFVSAIRDPPFSPPQ